MVKSIVIDENANSSLNQLIQAKRDSSKTGLLIGTVIKNRYYTLIAMKYNLFIYQIDQSKDYIVNVVATPVDDGGDGGTSGGSDKDWIINHALQVVFIILGSFPRQQLNQLSNRSMIC